MTDDSYGKLRMKAVTDAVAAAAGAVRRAGATEFEVGYLDDDVLVEEARWWASTRVRGRRFMVDDQPGPAEAAEALARKVLRGAKCRCGRLVALDGDPGGLGGDKVLADGTAWTHAAQEAAGTCLWRRHGDTWHRQCESRATRRAPGR